MTDTRHEDLLRLIGEHVDFIDAENAYCYEIGDGTINYLYRVEDVQGNSVIVKHADKASKRNTDFLLSTSRLDIEFQQLNTLGEILPSFVPKIYHFDRENHYFIMEDLKDYEILRVALNDSKKFAHFAAQITRYLFSTLFTSTDLVAPSIQKKMAHHSILNPEMAEVIEHRIFNTPYLSQSEGVQLLPENLEFAEKYIYNNGPLIAQVGMLKYAFKNLAQSVLHGELSTGNIFINQEQIKVFDHEFAMYGPMGFDIGTLLGSMMPAWIHSYLSNRENKEEFTFWMEETIERIFTRFQYEYDNQYYDLVTDPIAKNDDFKTEFWNHVREDIIGYTGIEMIQAAMLTKHVQEAARKEPENRMLLERLMLLIGSHLILNRREIESGKQMCGQVKKIIEENISEIA